MQPSEIINLASLGVAALAIIVSYLNNQKNNKEYIKREERDELITLLDEFYGPYQQLLETSKQLYEKLNSNKEKGWSALSYLLNGNEFTENDKYLFEEIIQVTNQLEKLRLEHGRLVAKANAHFRILSLAYQKKIQGEVNRFQDSTYPSKLNQTIDSKIIQINKRINNLKGNS